MHKLINMFFSKFMLLFIFIPNTEGLEKCLVKENYKLVCHIENENRYSQKVIEVSNLNPDQCQEKCVNNKKCSFYSTEQKLDGGYSCSICSHGKIWKSDDRYWNRTAGICPKHNKPIADIPNDLETKFWCQKGNEDLCRFPFIFNRTKYYEPVKKQDGTRWCGTEDNLKILTYDSSSRNYSLVECEVCKGKISLSIQFRNCGLILFQIIIRDQVTITLDSR